MDIGDSQESYQEARAITRSAFYAATSPRICLNVTPRRKRTAKPQADGPPRVDYRAAWLEYSAAHPNADAYQWAVALGEQYQAQVKQGGDTK